MGEGEGMDEVAGGSELDLDGFVIYSILFYKYRPMN